MNSAQDIQQTIMPGNGLRVGETPRPVATDPDGEPLPPLELGKEGVVTNRGFQINRYPGRRSLQRGQVSRVVTIDYDGGNRKVILETERLVEAANWTPDGKWLIVNEAGSLYRLPADGTGDLTRIDIGGIGKCNNDHILSFDGKRIYFSADGDLYVIPIEGGEPRRVSNEHSPPESYRYYLHGISPDEAMLAYVAVEPGTGEEKRLRSIALIPTAGGNDVRLTSNTIMADGPEYSPDGQWIYFNSEQNAKRRGHAQIFRMRPDGTDLEQLTFDERVNWFPHLSPDGKWFVYLSYTPGTVSHPADVDCIIRRLPADGGAPVDVTSLLGGQGSLNVNGWAPGSDRFAYVEYPAIR